MAQLTYFERMHKKTPTRTWINSVVQVEIENALRYGAVGITTNPSMLPKAVTMDYRIWEPVLKELLNKKPNASNEDIADGLNKGIAQRNAKLVFSIFKASKAENGYAAIQSNPLRNDELTTLTGTAREYSKIGENVLPKIPSTATGERAVEELTVEGINTIATMGFSVSQVLAMSAAYERGLRGQRKKPRGYVVIIPGIFVDYLVDVMEKEAIKVAPEVIGAAGLFLARRVYEVAREHECKADLIVGGTRKTYDVTGFVGRKLTVTHSFNTWVDLMVENPRIISSIGERPLKSAISELEEKFPDFRKAYEVDGLKTMEFRDFGPCVRFNGACQKGYSEVVAKIESMRHA